MRALSVGAARLRTGALVLTALLLAACDISASPLVVDDVPTASGAPRTAPPDDASPVASGDTGIVPDQVLGAWRPAPVVRDARLEQALIVACAAADSTGAPWDSGAGGTTVVDLRGEGFATVIHDLGLAEGIADHEARVCLATVDPAGAVLAAAGPVVSVSADLADQTQVAAIDVLDDRAPVGRALIVGWAPIAARKVIVGFADESEVYTSLGSGWFTAWWPADATPIGVGAVDIHNLVISSADPAPFLR